MKAMQTRSLVLALSLAALTAMAPAQQRPAPTTPQGVTVTPKAPYDSTRAQLYSTQMAKYALQFDASQRAFQEAQKELQAKYITSSKELQAWIDSVRKANGGGAEVVYDADKDQWLKYPSKTAGASTKVPQTKK
jgi:hypothetical protein